jgi:hypothetical protein
MTHHHDQGEQVRTTEHSAKTPSRRTGFFAPRCAFLHVPGNGAPTLRNRLTLVALAATLGVALLAPGTASAAFTRPFLREITSTPAGPLGASGLALDAKENLWVSEPGGSPPWKLDQFESAEAGNGFLKALKIEGLEPPKNISGESEGLTPPASLAIDNSTGSFYTTAESTAGSYNGYVEVFDQTGKYLTRFGSFGDAYVAVDNSTEPSSVYVAHSSANVSPPFGDGLPQGIEKLDASGNPVNFKRAEEPNPPSYLSANQITGTPSESFGFSTPSSIAVDSHGDIYTVVNTHLNGEEVDEYSPTGLFLGSFTGEETPGLGGSHEQGGWGGVLAGLAIDPLNGHLLVSLHHQLFGEANGKGAVDEFDSSGHFLNQFTEASPGHPFTSAGAMTVDSHGDLYLVGAGAVDVYGPGHFLPSFKLAEASEREPSTALLSGEVDPEGFPLTDCHFEYVTEAAFKATGFSDLSSGGEKPCVPGAGSIPADGEFHAVHAELSGLSSGVTYRFRLVASSSGALGGTGFSAVLAFTAPHAPRVDSSTADNLSSTFADLHARIDPLGAAASYRFEYLSDADFQGNGGSWVGPHAAVAVPVPDAAVGAGGATGGEDAAVLQHVGGLAPATEYRFRVVASNECEAGRRCVTEGADGVFSTLGLVAPGLPDNRAYELLTPPDKGGAEDMFSERFQNDEFQNERTALGYSSQSGDGFLLTARSAFGAFAGSPENAYVFSRTAAGWSTMSLAAPSLGGVQDLAEEVAFDPVDLSRVGVEDTVGSAVSAAGGLVTNLLGPPGGPYTTVHTSRPLHITGNEVGENTNIVGASGDLGHLVLESRSHTLCPGAEAQDEGSRLLCEYSAGKMQLLSLNPEGEPFRCGAALGAGRGISGTSHDAVSADGSRVIFTAPDPNAVDGGPGCWNGESVHSPQMYLRSGGSTVEVSAPEAGVVDPTGPHAAFYVGASADGSRVFFATEAELTQEAVEDHLHDPELYEYNVETGGLTRISGGESGHSAGGIWTVPAVSADGSAVYFTANGVLAKGATAGECVEAGNAETCSLYRYDTLSGATTYIARVGSYDYPNATASAARTGSIRNEFALTFSANWYATPDGRYLLFATDRELTGYRTTQAPGKNCPTPRSQSFSTGHCDELYRYDSTTGSLVCVSCNPSGAPPASNALFTRSAPQSAPTGVPFVRAMSNDGSYAFFDTADALVPQDGNGTLDTYEWHDGRISLISSGHDDAPSYFLGSSADGSNVFFGTHARLVPADTDTAGDLYDARICTESDPCVKPPPGETAQCEGDACQNPPPAPIDATPGSLTFSGAGNLQSELKLAVAPKTKTAAQIRAQNLARALKACKKDRSKTKRKSCEVSARKRYGAAKRAKRSAKPGRRTKR